MANYSVSLNLPLDDSIPDVTDARLSDVRKILFAHESCDETGILCVRPAWSRESRASLVSGRKLDVPRVCEGQKTFWKDLNFREKLFESKTQ